MKRVKQHFATNSEVAFVTVQTVFEGFESNTLQRAKASVDKFGIRVPTGHDVGPNGTGSPLMRRYRTGGTPWVVIIDQSGVVRFNNFHIAANPAIELITKLLAVPTSQR